MKEFQLPQGLMIKTTFDLVKTTKQLYGVHKYGLNALVPILEVDSFIVRLQIVMDSASRWLILPLLLYGLADLFNLFRARHHTVVFIFK